MKLADLLILSGIDASAGTQATTADSPSADKWIKDWMDRRQNTLNEIRQNLSRTYDPERPKTERDVNAVAYDGKPAPFSQDPGKTANGGPWGVYDPTGLILSTHQTLEEAQRAASAQRYTRIHKIEADALRDMELPAQRWIVTDPEGILLSEHATQEDAQNSVAGQKDRHVVDLGAGEELRAKYLGVRSENLQKVDLLRKGILVPSKEYWRRTTGGTGGAAGPDRS